MHAERRRGRPRSRILYWFRTPPGVRVGRSALDENAIRLIEEHNPGLSFDWTRILKGEGGASAETRPRQEPQERRARAQKPREAAPPPSQPRPARPAVEPETAVPSPPSLSAELPVAPLPVHVDEALGLAEPDAEPGEPSAALPESTAAQARLGSEGLQRLRARHAEVLARISEKISDPVRREELKAQAERLNPDTWVTDAEVVAGLEQYEAVFESLRGVVGRRRRRRKRRGSGRPGEEAAEATAEGAPAGPDDENGGEPDEDPGL